MTAVHPVIHMKPGFVIMFFAALAFLAAPLAARSSDPQPHAPDNVAHGNASATSRFLLDESSHVLVGVVAALGGVFAHRSWARRRWRRAPSAVVIEAVLVVDIVNSTWLATHHGENLAMRARNVLERRTQAAGSANGVTFVENTGDGCMMTFPSVDRAVSAACTLLLGLEERPPELAPGLPLEVRAAITYGQILIDSRGSRHGATINEAFRLMGVTEDNFVVVEGEDRLGEIPDRNRVFLDEDAVNELGSSDVVRRRVGVCRLKGFSGFHRVEELLWAHAGQAQSASRLKIRGVGERGH